MKTLNLESLESRTLLASLIESDTLSQECAETSTLLPPEEVPASMDSSETLDKESHKHDIKHRLSKLASKAKHGIEEIVDTLKHEGLHTLDEALKVTGEAIRASSPGQQTADGAVFAAAKIVQQVEKHL